jgi:LCP family protein required for cell wall assembly
VNPTRNKAVTSIIQPEDQVNILLLGSDLLPNGAGFRTDVIILVTVNKADKTVSVTSFPRDLYLYIPGWTDQRINTAYPHGGFNTLRQTFSHNFGFSPDYFILINLWSFEYIVNDLGGINVNVPRTVCDNNWSGSNYHCVYAGTQHLYGKEALWYVRTRKTTNDFDRNVRQQLALEAILNRFFSLDIIGKIPDLYKTYKENVVTNLDLGTVLDLVPTALKLKEPGRVNQYYINDSVVTDWVTPGGAQVLLPNYANIRSILKQALNSPYAK